MHSIDLILTLAAGFITVLTLGYLTHRMGWSPIVGCLLAGVCHFHIKDLPAVKGIARVEALPMRDAFAVMFFLSVGLLFDPRQALEAPLLSLMTLATLGRQLGALDDAALNAFEAAGHRAVVVGYGRTGQTASRIPRQRGIEPSVSEMNVGTFRRLRSEGHSVVYGDANQTEVLEQAGIKQATSLILSASGAAALTEAVRVARQINPHIHVVARSAFLRDGEALRKAARTKCFPAKEKWRWPSPAVFQKLGARPSNWMKPENAFA